MGEDRPETLDEALELLTRFVGRRLERDIPPGRPLTAVAAALAWRRLATALADAFDAERARLEEVGLSLPAADAGACARRMREAAREALGRAARLEAAQLEASDPERYVELRLALADVNDAAGAAGAANLLVQAVERIGETAARRLWSDLERRATRLRIRIPPSLRRRFKSRLPGPQARAPAAPGPFAELERLEREARHLDGEAASLPKRELFLRIVSIGARLKALQEQSAPSWPEPERRRLRAVFGTLTRISREHRPGYTDVLDSSKTGRDWRAAAAEADRRLEALARERDRARRRGRKEQIREALARLRAEERRMVFREALDRLRARLYHLAGERDEQARDRLLREARTAAAIACRAAEGTRERLEELERVLGSHRDSIARGREFRALRRLRGAPEEDAAPADLDRDELEAVTEALAEDEWPEEILDRRGAGAGERVLLVGGLPSEPRRRALASFFGWSASEWIESYRDHAADLKTLRRRLRDGRFDRVVVLARFCGHDVSQGLAAAARRCGVAYSVHPRGVSIPAFAREVYSR
ncbi:MAG: hypothetical protein D6718_01505 [Acidobacteria bacterium]|nr:MAG: hypothetical protein D6718_01505 [Acidobacteriota bacterium]